MFMPKMGLICMSNLRTSAPQKTSDYLSNELSYLTLHRSQQNINISWDQHNIFSGSIIRVGKTFLWIVSRFCLINEKTKTLKIKIRSHSKRIK